MTLVLRGVRPYGEEAVDLVVADGVIVDLAPAGTAAGEVIDAQGLVALPGFVDLHTHLREPGREDAETVLTGSQAAALGGYTCVHAMANTSPVADTAGVVEQVWRLGQEAGLVDVRPVGAVTVGLGGEHMAEIGAMATSAAEVRVFSDDGKCVHDAVLMRRALEYVKAFDGVVAQHAQAEDPASPTTDHPGRSVHREHVKRDRIARFETPRADREFVAPRVDVGQVGEGTFREPCGSLIEEGSRHQPRTRVRTGHEFER